MQHLSQDSCSLFVPRDWTTQGYSYQHPSTHPPPYYHFTIPPLSHQRSLSKKHPHCTFKHLRGDCKQHQVAASLSLCESLTSSTSSSVYLQPFYLVVFPFVPHHPLRHLYLVHDYWVTIGTYLDGNNFDCLARTSSCVPDVKHRWVWAQGWYEFKVRWWRTEKDRWAHNSTGRLVGIRWDRQEGKNSPVMRVPTYGSWVLMT